MVVTREVTYDVDGLTMVAHLARPHGTGPWPSVLIGHDGIGLDGYQRGRADDLAEPGADHDRLAALGYGAGGRIVLELASAGVPFTALASIHPGLPAARTEDWVNVGGAFLLCTGSEDPLCTPAQLFTFISALQGAGVDWRVNVYGGAKHAFWAAPMHPDGSPTGGTTHAVATVPGVGHHAVHATRAWQAVLDLFDEAMGPSSASIIAAASS